MSSQNHESHSPEDGAPDLELNKETLQDLDLEPADANEVKGGGMSTAPSTGRSMGQPPDPVKVFRVTSF